MEQKADIQLTLSAENASNLALFLKRLDSTLVRQKSASDFEADEISASIYSVLRELASHGFDPR